MTEVEVSTPIIESKLTFLEMQIKDSLRDAIELGLSSQCLAQEAFDAVDATFLRGELIAPMVDSKVLSKPITQESGLPS